MARRSRSAAPAAGDALLEHVRERLVGEGWPAGLTVLSGDDRYHLDAVQRELLSALVPGDASDFALTVFDNEPVDVSKVVAAARSQGMFAPRRVVLVRDVEVLDGEPEPLQGYAANPPSGSYLLVRATSLDQRRKLHKVLAKAGTRLDFAREALDARSATRLARSMAAERGLQLSADAGEYLLDSCRGDLYQLANELDKLAIWKRGGGKLSLDDCRRLVSGRGASSGWEVGEALLLRDTGAALAAIRQEFESASEAPSSLAIGMLGRVSWRARTMLQAKAMLENGARPDEVVRRFRVWRQRDEFVAGLRRYRMDELKRFPSVLLEADRWLKSRSIAPQAVLETAIERMTARS